MIEAEQAEDSQEIDNQEGELQEEQQIQEEQPYTREQWQADQEDQAKKHGWLDFDEHIERGRDPKDWRSAEVFNERGKSIHRERKQREEFEREISGLNQLHKAKLEQERQSLLAKQREAVENGDTEAYDQTRKDLETLDAITAPQQPIQDSPYSASEQELLNDWNSSNPWIASTTPKADYTRSQFDRYRAAGLSVSDTLSRINMDLEREYPDVNPNRFQARGAERGRGGGKPVEKTLTWGELTKQEINIYNSMPNSWKTKEDFLKAVQNDRKGG